MRLWVDRATRRIMAATDEGQDGGQTLSIEGVDLEVVDRPDVPDVDALYAEAQRLGTVIDLDDILVDEAGRVVGVSRERPIPVEYVVREELRAALAEMDRASTSPTLGKLAARALRALAKAQNIEV